MGAVFELRGDRQAPDAAWPGERPVRPWRSGRASLCRWSMRAALFVVAAWASAAGIAAQTSTAKPRLPPGRDPGGALIGLITSGIDPTRGEVARCLARDGEGELLGWDLVDRDRQPFRSAPPAQLGDEMLFQTLPCDGRVRIAPVRVDPADPVSYGKALAFFFTTPVRVVVIPTSVPPMHWTALLQAATEFDDLLVLVATTDKPPGLELQRNVVVLPPGSGMAYAVKRLLCPGSSVRDPGCR